jgi:hypothetical protein
LNVLREKYHEWAKNQPQPNTSTIQEAPTEEIITITEVKTPKKKNSKRKLLDYSSFDDYLPDESDDYQESENEAIEDDDFLISDEDVKSIQTRSATPSKRTSTRKVTPKKINTPTKSKSTKKFSYSPKVSPYKRKFTSGNVEYVDEDIVSTRVKRSKRSLIDSELSINNTCIQL